MKHWWIKFFKPNIQRAQIWSFSHLLSTESLFPRWKRAALHSPEPESETRSLPHAVHILFKSSLFHKHLKMSSLTFCDFKNTEIWLQKDASAPLFIFTLHHVVHLFPTFLYSTSNMMIFLPQPNNQKFLLLSTCSSLTSLVFSASVFSTQLSRWRSCHHAVQSHSWRSDPQQSRASGCCPSGPAAPWTQCGSLGPSPTPDFSADCHTDLRHCSGLDSQPRSEVGAALRTSWWVKRRGKEKETRFHESYTIHLKIHDHLNYRWQSTAIVSSILHFLFI